MAGEINNENYIVIQGWMINDLDIKGNELIVYAIIYGFSQTEGQVFSGSLQYLANWTRSTKQGISKNLKSLVEKGYIVKNDKYINGVKFCEYYATKFKGVCNKVDGGIQQSLIPPMQQSLTNNIDLYNTNNNTNNKKESKKETFDDLINNFISPDGKNVRFKNSSEIRDLLQEWLKVRKSKRAAMTNKAIELNLKKLETLAIESKMNITTYLEEVIARGWTAFYKINNYDKPNASNSYKREEIVPEWFNKEYEKKPMSEEEQQEMDKLVKEIIDNKEDARSVLDFETRRAALQEKLRKKYAK